MKRIISVVAVILALVLAMSAPALAQDEAKTRELVGKVLLMELAEQLGLAPDEVGILMSEYAKYTAELDELKAAREAAKKSLAEAIDAGTSDSALLNLLDKLVDLDEQLAGLKVQYCEAYMADLSGEQLARLYLFLADFEQNVCDAMKAMGSCAASQGEAAAAPECPAADAAAASPGDRALEAAKAWGAALAEQDLDKVMAVFSDDFEHYEYGDKQGIADFIGQAMDMGYLEDLEVDMDDAEAEVDGNEIIIYPIDLLGAFGSVTFELVFKDVDGAMKIVGLDASGI